MADTGETTSATTSASPAPAAAAPSAAPAAATPDSAPSTPGGDGTPVPKAPTTMAEGFVQWDDQRKAKDAARKREERAAAKAAAPGATPGAADPNAPPPANTSATPVESQPPVPVKQGPIPFDRHQAALKNAREKAAEEARQQLLKEHPYLARASARDITEAMTLRDLVRRNPERVVEALQRKLGAVRPSAVADAMEDLVEADLQTTDGSHKLLSDAATRRLMATAMKRLGEQFEQRVAKLDQFIEAQQAAAAKVERERIVEDRISQLMARPGAKEHLEDIVTLMETEGLSDDAAYLRVVTPTLSSESEKLRSRIAELEAQLKDGASTSPRPGASGTGAVGTRKYGSTREGFEKEFQRVDIRALSKT